MGYGREKTRRSLHAQLRRKAKDKFKRKRTRQPKGRAEEKYISLRTGLSPRKRFDEAFDMMLSTHLRGEYVDNSQFNSLIQLTGKIEATRSQMLWRATRADMQRYFAFSEKQKWNKKFKLTRREAAARFATGKNPKKIKYIRPKEFYAKQSSQYYPKPGSSEGKIKTKIIGAKRVDKAFADMIKAIFSIGEGLEKLPHIKVKRTFK